MTTTAPTTEQMTLHKSTRKTSDLTSSDQTINDAQPTSPKLRSLYVVKSIGGCLSEPDVVSTPVGGWLHCGILCHEHSQSKMNGRGCASFNFYGLKSGKYFCELNFRRFDSDTDTLTNHNDCFYYERG
ncbi:hypothetical protein HOLleu_44952 [Holothuria leucospilota]|uniref:Uncharacterized protein n=1 Tax=Holothuria leucospilota TaxID=206669 RepID=A0A9Q1B961_HOLLE|nr:hypothetical protein HOLleu_44952 [Holothuria leucospilota]